MKHPVGHDGLKPRRRPLLVWLPALALTVVSLVGTGWALRSPDRASVSSDGEDSTSRRTAQVVICLGLADVDGGILSLYPTMPGRVVEVAVAENEAVKEGVVLVRLDDEAARAQVMEAEAALQAAEAQLVEARKAPQRQRLLRERQQAAVTAAEHDLAAARLMASRKEEQARQNLINPKEADAAAEQVKKLDAALEAERARLDTLALRDPDQEVKKAEADVSGRRAALERARHALREHALRAPSAGTVLRVLTSAGEVLGSTSRQPAVLFAPDRPRIVRAEVEQEFVGRVSVGQRAEIEDDSTSDGRTWKGHVDRVAEWFAPRRTIIPDTPTLLDVRTLECIVKLDKDQPPLRIGQRVRVRLFEK